MLHSDGPGTGKLAIVPDLHLTVFLILSRYLTRLGRACVGPEESQNSGLTSTH